MRGSAPRALDVYLFPAVVGAGLGDLQDVWTAGKVLETQRARILLFREDGRPIPRGVDEPLGWPKLTRLRELPRLEDRAASAITVSSQWGITCAPGRDEPLGAPGPWAIEAQQVESTYGWNRTLHVSLEEFARTQPAARLAFERFREGGASPERMRLLRHGERGRREVARFRSDFRKYRALNRPNVLHIFPGFVYPGKFASEFPEAVPTGPLWPTKPSARRPGSVRPRETWVWYASPGSSIRLLPQLANGLERPDFRTTVLVRTSRSVELPAGTPSVTWRTLGPSSPKSWARRWATADLLIVTGSRSLLEAIQSGRPFLYFNGVTGSGSRTRRHRPEKIQSLLRLWALGKASIQHRRDLANFSAARGVATIVRRARFDNAWRRRFPRGVEARGFTLLYRDAAVLLQQVSRRFCEEFASSVQLVREIRENARARA